MGKKRRIINRIHKFGKKYFAFLDGLDGTRDSQLLSSKLQTMISEINISDLGNQTISLQFEGFGPGTSAQATGLEKDRVVYSINGSAVNVNGIQTFAAAEHASKQNNRNNLATTTASPARTGAGATDIVLAAGDHTISAHIVGEAAVAATATIAVQADIGRADLEDATLTLNDGTGDTVFTIKADEPVGDGTNEVLGLGGAGTVDAIASAIITGLEAHSIDISAQDASGDALADDIHEILLTQGTKGAAGNTAIASTAAGDKLVANGEKFSGGFDADSEKKSTKLSKSFLVKRAHVDLSSLTATKHPTQKKIIISCEAVDSVDVATAKGSLAGEVGFTLGNGPNAHAISLRVKDENGDYVTLDADANNIITTENNEILKTSGTLLQKGNGEGGSTIFADGIYFVEASPCKKDGTPVTEDAQIIGKVEIK
tara:strand:+ start:774 stop:2060 length:1287 start_codon:yes stop_codon:yes gene_type:complete